MRARIACGDDRDTSLEAASGGIGSALVGSGRSGSGRGSSGSGRGSGGSGDARARQPGMMAPGTTTPALLLLLAVLLGPGLLLANGGTLRVANAEVGPYWVSIFTDPTPVRADTLDVSILITEIEGLDVVPGLDVTVRADPVGHDGTAQALTATREAADDPRYYAAKFSLGTTGTWRLTVDVRGDTGGGDVAFEVDARETRLLDRPLVLIFVSLLPLFLAAWWFLRPTSDGGKRQRASP